MVGIGYAQITTMEGVKTIPFEKELFQGSFSGRLVLFVPFASANKLMTAILSTGVPLI
jgi:hypothetical protein